MSLWIDFIGTETRFVETPSFGRTRIVEAGRGAPRVLILMHGVGGHVEAYAKNIVALSDEFHVIAYDFPGHGQSNRYISDFSPAMLVDHLAELMDVLGIERAHLSGESLGGWTGGLFANRYPARVERLVLNTAAGIPIVSEKGHEDLNNLIELSRRSASQQPTTESVRSRMQWLLHEKNWSMLSDEMVATRLHYYRDPGARVSGPLIGKSIASDLTPYLIDLPNVRCETLFLWTRDNPIHDLEAARSACDQVPGAQLYVMHAEAAHWPQYEAPDEFNSVVRKFLLTGTA